MKRAAPGRFPWGRQSLAGVQVVRLRKPRPPCPHDGGTTHKLEPDGTLSTWCARCDRQMAEAPTVRAVAHEEGAQLAPVTLVSRAAKEHRTPCSDASGCEQAWRDRRLKITADPVMAAQ